MSKYLQVLIRVEKTAGVEQMVKILVEKKLVIGSQIITAPVGFSWKKETPEKEYLSILGFTSEEHKEKIITEVKTLSSESTLTVSFELFEGNEELIQRIDKALKN